jgi:uncharacterized protein (DUF2249 family)
MMTPMEDPATPPLALAAIPEARRIQVDVRDDLRRGHEPFGKIMAAVAVLGADQALEVRAPFEPVPLYRVLARQGLSHWTLARGPDDWFVWFYREAPGPPAPGRRVTLDVRGLEPPQPMVLVLERLDTLAEGETLEVIHSRRPMFLYPQLDDRGYLHETDEPEPGVVRILIRRGVV